MDRCQAAASSHYGEMRTLAAGHAFVAAEQPDVPCPERDLLTRWMALAAEYVSHRGGRRNGRLVPAPVMQDVYPGNGARIGAGRDGD
jgi:hypothetical protein